MRSNPQISLNKFVIQHLDHKSLFKESTLKVVLKAAGAWNAEKQKFFIQNSKFFRKEPISLNGHGAVWVLLKRNIVANIVVNTNDASVKTISESLI